MAPDILSLRGLQFQPSRTHLVLPPPKEKKGEILKKEGNMAKQKKGAQKFATEGEGSRSAQGVLPLCAPQSARAGLMLEKGAVSGAPLEAKTTCRLRMNGKHRPPQRMPSRSRFSCCASVMANKPQDAGPGDVGPSSCTCGYSVCRRRCRSPGASNAVSTVVKDSMNE